MKRLAGLALTALFVTGGTAFAKPATVFDTGFNGGDYGCLVGAGGDTKYGSANWRTSSTVMSLRIRLSGVDPLESYAVDYVRHGSSFSCQSSTLGTITTNERGSGSGTFEFIFDPAALGFNFAIYDNQSNAASFVATRELTL